MSFLFAKKVLCTIMALFYLKGHSCVFFNNSENRMILNLIHLDEMSLLFKWMKQPNKSDLQKSHASLIRLLLTTAINQALKSALSTLFIFSSCLVLQLKKCVPRVKNRFYLTTLKYCKKCNNNKQINAVDI